MALPDRRTCLPTGSVKLILLALTLAAVPVGLADSAAITREVASPTALDTAKLAIREKDFARAAAGLQPPATRGDANAQYLLGALYLTGLLGSPDMAAATLMKLKMISESYQTL